MLASKEWKQKDQVQWIHFTIVDGFVSLIVSTQALQYVIERANVMVLTECCLPSSQLTDGSFLPIVCNGGNIETTKVPFDNR